MTSGVKQLKEIKKEKLKSLRDKLAAPSTVKMEQQFYVVLPTAKAHEQSHETGGAILFAQCIHPQLVKRIYELVAEGIIDTQEVKRHLKHYVLHVMCLKQKPNITDRCYFPTSTDIRNHIYKAQQTCQLSKLDQENLKLKIDSWRQENASSLYFFRPFTQCDNEDDTSSSQTLATFCPSRALATGTFKKIWEQNDFSGCHIQDNKVRTGFIFCNSEDKCWI